MNPPDNWQPPPCKHGVKPTIDVTLYDDPRVSTYNALAVARKQFSYDCPTPQECWTETWKQATEQN